MKITLVGITYSESKHQENLANLLSILSNAVSRSWTVQDKKVISYQPQQTGENEIKKIKFLRNATLSYWLFMFSYASKIARIRSLFKSLQQVLRLSLGMKSNLGNRENPEYMRRDLFLTDKHIRAFYEFLEQDSDALLITSDDITYTEIRPQIFSEIHDIVEESTNRSLYFELAPYYKIETLEEEFGLKSINSDKNESLRIWRESAFFCNTGGAYVVSRRFAENMIELITHSPSLRNCSIDWLLTYAVTTKFFKNEVDYYFPTEIIFKNESLETGISSSIFGENGEQ